MDKQKAEYNKNPKLVKVLNQILYNIEQEERRRDSVGKSNTVLDINEKNRQKVLEKLQVLRRLQREEQSKEVKEEDMTSREITRSAPERFGQYRPKIEKEEPKKRRKLKRHRKRKRCLK
eukprot:UN25158